MIPVYKPYLPSGSLDYAHKALDSGWLSQGEYLIKAREMLSEIWGTKWIILTNSGTAANHMIARTMRVKYPEKRNLVVPNNVYVAAWNPFIQEDFTLWPQDADINTWNMDLGKRRWHMRDIEFKPSRTTILLAVHNLGNTINVPEWKKMWPDAVIIEDNCEGFGGMYGDPLQNSGTASEAFSMSFYGNKNLTTGEGGAFVTYDEDIYHYAHAFHGQGQANKKFIHNIAGYNYRMNNIQAAILCGQLEIRSDIFEMKAAIFDYYTNGFRSMDGVDLQYSQPNTEHSNWMFGIRLLGNKSYEEIKRFMDDAGIETRPMFYPMSYHKHLHRDNNRNVARHHEDVAKQLSKEVVVLPSFPELTVVQQDFIIDKVGEYVQKYLLF